MRDRQKPQEKSVTVAIDDTKNHDPKLRAIGGSAFDGVNNWFANLAINAIQLPDTMNQEEKDRKASQVIMAMIGLAPKDEIEGMLCGQLVATSATAMTLIHQRIVVERVQVAPGGTAVLGDVHQTPGGGAAQKEAHQSHEHETPAGRLTAPCEPSLQGAIEADQTKVPSASGTR